MTAINEGVPRVFLDTEVFVHENFDYKSPRFRSLMTLALAGRIQVFLTDLTLREIEANIRSRVNEAVVSIRPNAVLRNSGFPRVRALFEKLEVARIQEELVSQLEKYLKAAKVTVLKVPPIVLPLVLDAYFERQPPFGVGKKTLRDGLLELNSRTHWCLRPCGSGVWNTSRIWLLCQEMKELRWLVMETSRFITLTTLRNIWTHSLLPMRCYHYLSGK